MCIRDREYTERALGQLHTGIYGLGEWRELIDKKTGEAYQISSCLLYTSIDYGFSGTG